jgi:hypothetical protein
LTNIKLTDEQVHGLDCFATRESMVLRARAGCLAADTIININRGGVGGEYVGYGKGSRKTIEHIVGQACGHPIIRFTRMGREVVQRARRWDSAIPTFVARADGDVSRLGMMHDAWASGVRLTYEVKTESGRSIRATLEHPFMVDGGSWAALSELRAGQRLRVNSGRSARQRQSKNQYRMVATKFHPFQISNGDGRSKVAAHRAVVDASLNGLSLSEFLSVVNGDPVAAASLTYLSIDKHVHHVDENTLNNDLSNLRVMTAAEHLAHHANNGGLNHVLWQIGSETIESIREHSEEPTYDISMADEPHNFLANGFVVHNSGKTTELRLCGESANPRRGLYLAYNKGIQVDAERSFSTNVMCRTAHSLAYAAVGHLYRDRMDGPRISSRRTAEVLDIDKVVAVEGSLKLKPHNVARLVMETVLRFCWSADDEVRARHVPYVRGMETVRDEVVPYVVAKARRAWNDLQDVDGRLRFEMDHYLKMYVLQRPYLRFSFLLIDEVQDLNPVLIALVEQQLERGTQVVLVGDGAQQIYEWRGAVNALDRWNVSNQSTLSQSFRFGPAVAEEANKWLDLLGEDPPITGFEGRRSTVHDEPASAASAILCRTNGTMVSRALALDDKGKKFGLAGGDKAVKKIRSWANAAESLMEGRGCDHPDLYLFKTWREVQEHVAEEPSDIGVMVRLIDNYGVKALKRVAAAAVDERQADVVLSTAHSAKGREWSTVEIADDFGGDGPEPSDGEKRLAYVAVTRAQDSLHRGSLACVDDHHDALLRLRARVSKSIDASILA